jgi:hypothetical protein
VVAVFPGRALVILGIENHPVRRAPSAPTIPVPARRFQIITTAEATAEATATRTARFPTATALTISDWVVGPGPIEACHRLGEVNPYTAIVHENVLHFEVGLFGVLVLVKLNKCVL